MAPRKGHLEAMIHLFGYLEHTRQGRIVVDIGEPPIRKEALFMGDAEWSEFYEDTEEAVPHDLPQSHGRLATLTTYVDADHARDMVSRRSITGVIMLLNNTPVYWLSKWQKTVETTPQTHGEHLKCGVCSTFCTHQASGVSEPLRRENSKLQGEPVMLIKKVDT